MCLVSIVSWAAVVVSHEVDVTFPEYNAKVLCRHCGATLAYRNDYHRVLSTSKLKMQVSREESLGPKAVVDNFRSPENSYFDVVTFKNVENIKLSTAPYSSAATFFPPYSWKITTCSRCGHQVGWHFHDLDQPDSPSDSIDHGQKTAASSAPSPRIILDPTIASMTEKAIVDSSLRGICLTLPKGWWNYQWCHEKEIRQFHEESGKRTLDWSLGKFDAQGAIFIVLLFAITHA
jgi:protein OS-9